MKQPLVICPYLVNLLIAFAVCSCSVEHKYRHAQTFNPLRFVAMYDPCYILYVLKCRRWSKIAFLHIACMQSYLKHLFGKHINAPHRVRFVQSIAKASRPTKLKIIISSLKCMHFHCHVAVKSYRPHHYTSLFFLLLHETVMTDDTMIVQYMFGKR